MHSLAAAWGLQMTADYLFAYKVAPAAEDLLVAKLLDKLHMLIITLKETLGKRRRCKFHV